MGAIGAIWEPYYRPLLRFTKVYNIALTRENVAPPPGLEPGTHGLTVRCSAN